MKKLLVYSLLVFASALLLEQALSASARLAINAASAQAPEKLSAELPGALGDVRGNVLCTFLDDSKFFPDPAQKIVVAFGNSLVNRCLG
jgi:hypothetical protein